MHASKLCENPAQEGTEGTMMSSKPRLVGNFFATVATLSECLQANFENPAQGREGTTMSSMNHDWSTIFLPVST